MLTVAWRWNCVVVAAAVVEVLGGGVEIRIGVVTDRLTTLPRRPFQGLKKVALVAAETNLRRRWGCRW